MKRWVIDAGVVVKLFFQEEHSAACERAVKSARRLLAPDLVWIESASVVRKRVRSSEIRAEDASGIMADMLRVPIDTYPSWSLIRPALQIAIETERTVYDCLYIALAIQEECLLLTADERLCNALAKTPWAANLRFVGADA